MHSTPDAVILCGGAGLRLRPITGSTPKGLAEVAGRPFLELLLQQLRRSGFERVVLAVGYQKEMIQRHFGNQAFGLEIVYSVESSPLGTGGALRLAADLVKSEDFLAMNGDSYTDVDLQRFVIDHRESRAAVSVVVVSTDGRSDCGSVQVEGDRKVVAFHEKPWSAGATYINAGIYVITQRFLSDIPPGLQLSLERELIPRWLADGYPVRAFVCLTTCVDIGTPERYRGAQEILANVEVSL